VTHERRQEPPYRTVLVIMFLAAMELAAVALLAGKGATGEGMLMSFTACMLGLAGGQVVKRVGEKAVAGRGLKAGWRTLTTEETPNGPPAPPEQSPVAPMPPPAVVVPAGVPQ
jgi:hypothetical protein